MKLIVGLGKSGPKYETTRHNVGFLAVDRLIDSWHASGPKQQHSGLSYSGSAPNGEKIILCKPQTYMNASGKCVAPLLGFYQCKPEDLIVIHYDLDLAPLVIRLKTGGGTGGHNGLKSIDQSLGKDATGYHRIRIGVGHPARLEPPRKQSPADYVLEPFADVELTELDLVLDQVVEACGMIIRGEMKQAMLRFHTL